MIVPRKIIPFLPRIKRDGVECKFLAKSSIYLFGFICALIDGKYGCVNRFSISPKTADDVRAKLKKYESLNVSRVIIIDEFCYPENAYQSVSNEEMIKNTNWLRLLRNIFRAVGFTVIVTGTDVRVANLINLASESRPEYLYPWCYIYSAFPRFLEKCIPNALLTQLNEVQKNIILHSRPILAKLAIHSLSNSESDVDDDLMFDYVFQKSIELKSLRNSKEAVLEQLILPLNVSHALANGQTFSGTPLIGKHFGRLDTRGRDMVVLFNNASLEKDGCTWKPKSLFPDPSRDALLHLSFVGTRYSNPILVRGSGYGPYRALANAYILKTNQRNFTMEWMQNANQRSESGNYFEAVLSSVISIASHVDGIGGTSLKKLLFTMAYHLSRRNIQIDSGSLSSTDDQLPIQPGTITKKAIKCLGYFADKTVPYFSVPNVQWPGWLAAGIPALANLSHTVNSEKVDWKSNSAHEYNYSSSVVSGEIISHSSDKDMTKKFVSETDKNCSGETKYPSRIVPDTAMKEMLLRIPNNSWLHIMLTTKMQKAYFTTLSSADFFKQAPLNECLYVRMTVDDNRNAILSNLDKCLNIVRDKSSFVPTRVVIIIELLGFENLDGDDTSNIDSAAIV